MSSTEGTDLESEDNSEDLSEDDGSTDSVKTRHRYTNDLLAFILVVGTLGLVVGTGANQIDAAVLETDPALAFVVYTGVAVVWAFGADAVKAWRGN